MALYIAFTADAWLALHRNHSGLTDWWTKSTSRKFRRAQRGDWWVFRPRSAPQIVGWASVVEYRADRASVLWDALPRDASLFASWEERARTTTQEGGPDPVVASVMLSDLCFLPVGAELPMPADYAPVGTQEGLRYEDDDPNIAYLITRITDGRHEGSQPARGARRRRRAAASLVIDAYVRRNPGGTRVITPAHNRFLERFASWLHAAGYEQVEHERDYVDVRFRSGAATVFAEVKVCHGVAPRAAIREALGQIIEYNCYGGEQAASEWWIVLDEQPCQGELEYAARLRRDYALPVFLAYPSQHGVSFVVAR